jgi:hypothetical protein
MTRISIFDTSVQCEEFFAGYKEWSDELQAEFEAANEAAQTVQTERGAMLIPRECVHAGCRSSRCGQGLRIGASIYELRPLQHEHQGW